MSDGLESIVKILRAEDPWVHEAACGDVEDPEVFFGIPGVPLGDEAIKEAKRICNEMCSVKDQCLDFALDSNEKFGVWGGLDERERRKVRRDRRAKARIEEAARAAEVAKKRRKKIIRREASWR